MELNLRALTAMIMFVHAALAVTIPAGESGKASDNRSEAVADTRI